MQKLEHLIRYDTAQDKVYLEEYKDKIDFLVFNANILCHHSEDNAKTIYVNFPTTKFFIDPKLYNFQLDISNIKSKKKDKSETIKESFIKLASEYCLDYVIEKETPLSTNQVLKHGIQKLAQSVLDFQINFINEHLDSELKDLIEFSEQFRYPEILISASFCLLSENDLEWLSINGELLKKSLLLKNNYNLPIYANLIISKSILENKKLMSEIINTYSIADGLILWIDDFDEQSVNEEIIEALISFIMKYKEKNQNKKIYSLYGGYLSELLSNFGLNGVCHSVAYGESKKINRGGGKPFSKYYLPLLYNRVKPEDMIRLLRQMNIKTRNDFLNEICSCTACNKNIFDDNIERRFFVYLDDYESTTLIRKNAKNNCRWHYLEVKAEEFNSISTTKLKELVNNIYNTYLKLEKENYIDRAEYLHLLRWFNVLNKYVDDDLIGKI